MTAEALHADATPRVVARQTCPVCGNPAGAVCLTKDEIAEELRARDRFFAARLARSFSRDALRDLTSAVLGTPAAILRCARCGVLIRDAAPGDEAFRDDRYDDEVLEALHETHARAFAAKECDYRSLLPPGARVIEIGSYVGGFLSAAAQWGWRAAGVDIGRDPVRFCRGRGLDVQRRRFEACAFDPASADAVFIWNCFEQIAEPAEVLAAVRRVLCERGLLVIRVPDAEFYLRHTSLEVLAYNSLLGWPHRFGYDAASLRRLVQQHGFAFVRSLRRPAVRPLRDAMRAWAREEEARLIGDANYGWIEATFSVQDCQKV